MFPLEFIQHTIHLRDFEETTCNMNRTCKRVHEASALKSDLFPGLLPHKLSPVKLDTRG